MKDKQVNTVTIQLDLYNKITSENKRLKQAIDTIKQKGSLRLWGGQYNFLLMTEEETKKTIREQIERLQYKLDNQLSNNKVMEIQLQNYAEYMHKVETQITLLKQENQSLKNKLSQRTLWQWFKGLFISINQQPTTNN